MPKPPGSQPELHADPVYHLLGPDPAVLGGFDVDFGKAFDAWLEPLGIRAVDVDLDLEDILATYNRPHGVDLFDRELHRPAGIGGGLERSVLPNVYVHDLVFADVQIGAE